MKNIIAGNGQVTPVLSFDFNDLNETNGAITTAADGVTKATLTNALIEGGYRGNAPRFQYSVKGGAGMEPGTVASLWKGKTGYTVSMWIMPYQSLHGAHYFRLLSVYGTDDHALLEMSYSSPGIKVCLDCLGEAEKGIAITFPYALDTLIPPFDARNTNDGVWQFLTLSVDLVGSQVRFFVNGEELRPVPEVQISFAQDRLPEQLRVTCPDCIGGDGKAAERSFNGVIDQVNFYDRALDAFEISRLYASYGESETLSVTEKQKKLLAMVKKLGSSLVLKAGTTNAVRLGRVIKADVSDYSRKNILIDGELFIPADLVGRCFGTVEGSTLIAEGKQVAGRSQNGEIYFSAREICRAKGWIYVKPESEDGLYVMLADDSEYEEGLNTELLWPLEAFCQVDEKEPVMPVEQTRVVIATSDTAAGDYTYSPSITKIGDILYASRDISCRYTEVFSSNDKGSSWTYAGRVEDMWWATLFEQSGALYMIGRYTQGGISGSGPNYIGITRSTDGGRSWTSICKEQGGISYDGGLGVHCAPTPVLRQNGYLYRVFEMMAGADKREFLIRAEETADLLNPDSWTVSDYFTGYGFPNEGNAVRGPEGGVWIMARYVTNKAYLMKLDEEQNKVVAAKETMEASLISFPSTASKFTVRYDEKTGKYLALVNTQMDPNCAYQRNYATLAVSEDLVNWKVKQTLLCDREIYNEILSVAQHAVQYIDWIFDGDDILFVVRESAENAKNFHDSNYLTFYRIKDYAALMG